MTGARRGELIALRWSDCDVNAGVLTIQRNIVRDGGELVVKDTKTHQMRRIALDDTTTELLTNLRRCYEDRCKVVGAISKPDAYMFSHAPDSRRLATPMPSAIDTPR